jgi:hypothetical protein
LGVEPRPGMEIIQEPGKEPVLVNPDGTPVQYTGQSYPQMQPQAQPQIQPQTGYNAPVYSGPPAQSGQQSIQETPGTEGLKPGVIYQEGANGQLVPVTPQSGVPNANPQYPQEVYPSYPPGTQPNVVYPQQGYAPQQGYPQYPQQPQPQVYYPPPQGTTMQKRVPSQGQAPGGENIGYFNQPYGAPQGMYGRQPYYYPPSQTQGNTGISYPPSGQQTTGAQ